MYDDEEENVDKRVDDTTKKSRHTVRKCLNIDHEVVKLNVCCDAGYFTNEYVIKKLGDKTGNYPISCNECGKSYMN